jgi:hypothetical protein
MASSNSLAVALEAFRRNMVATQQGLIKSFVTQLRELPETRRPAEVPALFPEGIDERLDIFAMFFWDTGKWPLSGSGIPSNVEPVTTLEQLPPILPAIIEADHERLQSTLLPQPDAEREEYLRGLSELVMKKADANHAPTSLPAEYESLLKLTECISSPDLLHSRICEFGCALGLYNLDDLVPDLDEIPSYIGWEVSAGFVLGLAHDSWCNYVYCRNANGDAEENEKDWAWRVSFGSSAWGIRDHYVGDLKGFLDFYANIYDQAKLQERIAVEVRNLHRELGNYTSKR